MKKATGRMPLPVARQKPVQAQFSVSFCFCTTCL